MRLFGTKVHGGRPTAGGPAALRPRPPSPPKRHTPPARVGQHQRAAALQGEGRGASRKAASRAARRAVPREVGPHCSAAARRGAASWQVKTAAPPPGTSCSTARPRAGIPIRSAAPARPPRPGAAAGRQQHCGRQPHRRTALHPEPGGAWGPSGQTGDEGNADTRGAGSFPRATALGKPLAPVAMGRPAPANPSFPGGSGPRCPGPRSCDWGRSNRLCLCWPCRLGWKN